ncbi:MAG: sugar ABC transporter permease [Caldilineaceae bacterium]|nr:sugar ABC transporter permease [Caldilineaceae bacterium]MBP8108259.1 sugar ABC transporter permease [Caldilineaceae bacterium]MBP8121650.1 sugar ABC transporter permease [Caldilineaceae bacterium]MBP9071650.1 sugar ABC transporter permease [Caldilineaceae bacterium]
MAVKAPSIPTMPGNQRLSKRWLSGEALIAYLFIIPSLIGFVTFYAVPAGRGIWISLTNWNLLKPPTFIGLDNYTKLLGDAEFINSLKVTLYYVILNIPVQTILAIVIAVMMSRLTKSMIVRAMLILPWLMPPVVVGLLWLWLLDPNIGIVNVALKGLGLNAIAFLGLPKYAMPSVAMINIWEYVGYTALLVFAGLQSIPSSVYEAASIDGASEMQMFWQVTIPLLRPVLVFVLVTSVIGSFQLFDVVAITTKGGPVNATKVINWYIYEQAFSRFNMGYSTALSIVLFGMLVFVSLAQMRFMRAGESDM